MGRHSVGSKRTIADSERTKSMQCIENTKTITTTTTTTVISVLSLNSDFQSKSFFYDSASAESEENVDCVWRRAKLSASDFVIYAFVVPTLAFFGLCANFINAIVFMRPKMTPSAFTYLAALSWLDCISCLLITLTALSRSLLYSSTFWMAYDFQWQTPLFGTTTGAANLILAFVSLDRFIYLRLGIPKGTPKFCKRTVARRMVVISLLIAMAVNIPYFFVFVVNDDGTFQTTNFYFSCYYMIHNWLTFVLLTLLPALFLLIGNTAILIAFCKWTKQSKKCQKTCSQTTQKRYKHQMKLTVTIVIVITLYLVGELPASLTSRKSAVNLLYGGDVSKVNFKTMERLEVICITLNAIQLSINIIVYAVINPTFVPEFFHCLKEASDVCFKFTGITCISRSCRKLCQFKETEKLEITSECQRNYGRTISGDDWQLDEEEELPENTEAGTVCPFKENDGISIIKLQIVGKTFENPAYVQEGL